MRNIYHNDSSVELTTEGYNAVIGIVLVWGFALSALLIAFLGNWFATWNPILLIVIYIIVAWIGIHISRRSTDLKMSFLGYNLVVVPFGIVLSVILRGFPLISILHAVAITAAVAFVMLLAAIAFPRVFLSMGRILFFALLAVVVIEILIGLFGWYHPTLLDWIVAIIFALFIGYDWAIAQSVERTLDNAIDSCVGLYINVVNLFVRVLRMRG